MNLEGLTEKRRGKSTLWYENKYGEIVAKRCTKCGVVKSLDDYSKHKDKLGGRHSACKICQGKHYRRNRERKLESNRNWRINNKDKVIQYREKNKERRAELCRKWSEANRSKKALIQQRRRARKNALPNTLTPEQYEYTLGYFGNACALTGCTESVEIEHAIPIYVGYGGTTYENCYPMLSKLNQSKFNHNIFEWFGANRQRFELEQWRFDRLIEWLGKANGMTVEEYRDYVYECHANPNAIDEEVAI
jgi:hypothetical protein